MRNRMVYNDWGLYGFVQMLDLQVFALWERTVYNKMSAIPPGCVMRCKHKQDMPLWKRTYRCENENCGLVMDRDENSAVNIYQRFLAGPPPHTL